MRITLENVRIAFANGLFEAKAGDDGKNPKYSSSFLFPPNHPAVAIVEKAMDAVATEKWGAKGAAQLKALRAQDRVCLHNGDNKTYAGYPGNLYVSASNPIRPRVVDRNRNEVSRDSGVIYSGCRVIALLEIWAQDNKFGKRVNATLRGVQHFQDDEAFTGGGAASEDEFQELSTAGSEEEFA